MTSMAVLDVVGRGGLGRQLVEAGDHLVVVHARDRAHVDPHLGAGRDDVHLDRFPGPQHGRGEVDVAQVGVGGMGGLELVLERRQAG